MAMAGRLRSTLPLFSRIVRSNSFSTIQRSTVQRFLLCPSFADPQFLKSYASASPPKEQKVKVPLTMYGVSGNYATALYIAAAKANALKVVLTENGRLKHVKSIAKRFTELTMAHRGEMKAIVTTVIPLPTEEEKELKETLQDIIGQGKKVNLEQMIDPSILGGLVVEFGQKVFDISIKTRAKQMERFLRDPVNIGNL